MTKILKYILLVCLIAIVVLIGCYLSVSFNAKGRTFDKIEDIAPHEYGLLLGTSPFTAQGARNFYFENRIKAAVELYNAGKIKRIIASGGNYWYDEEGNLTKNGYNELRSMQDSLVKYGVPREVILLDYDGTRTLNSIAKAIEVYGLDSFVIISQQYHNERAIKQADHYGLKAIGYNAFPSHILRNRIKNQARELLARVKLYLDLWLGKKPQFDSYVVKIGDGIMQEWYDVNDSIPGLPNTIGHRCDTESSWGLVKYFSTYGDKPVYYNDRHGFYVELPFGMGYNQSGENVMGAHDNEFYNADTTLVVSAGAMFYDVVLDDIPQYADSLLSYEKDFLNKIGKHTFKEVSPNVWISNGRIDHSDEENPPADRFIRKWLLKKDISDRECHMSLTIYFNDSLEYRLPEFERIINQFPYKPNFKQ